MSGEGALYEYLMNADDPRDEKLENLPGNGED